MIYLAIKKVPINFAPPDHTSCQSTPHLQDGDTSCQLAINLGVKTSTNKLPVNVEDDAEGPTRRTYLNPVIVICRALDNPSSQQIGSCKPKLRQTLVIAVLPINLHKIKDIS